MGERIRLDKFLTEMNLGTRTQIKEAARKGRIQVNGETEKKSDRKIDPDGDQVTFDSLPISYAKMEYYMLNKPQGVVSATRDRLHSTVVDLITDRKRNDLFPVGRLDLDTEGLLLITNDGDLTHRLLSPKKHVDKVYYARIEGELPSDWEERFAQGILLEDGTCTLPSKLELLGSDSESREVRLTIHEGKFHQVKRMFEALDCRVTYLKRLSMGTLALDPNLEPGQYRELTEDELNRLKEQQ